MQEQPKKMMKNENVKKVKKQINELRDRWLEKE